jgi:GNAT superfamily N-acetyltransferase
MPPTAALALEPVTADDRAAMDGLFALYAAARAHDLPDAPPPCRVEHAARFDWPDVDSRVWVVREHDDVVAAAELGLPLRDDLDNAYAHLTVAPHRRRRGLGRRLLDHVAGQARAAGRVRLGLQTQGPLDADDPGTLLLRAAGARLGLVDVRRRLRLPPADPAVLAALTGEATAASLGYELVHWAGATPEGWLDDIAALAARMSTDAPNGELTLAAQHWDAARVRARDAAYARSGQTPYVTAALGPDGHLAAFTVLFACVERHANVGQGDTLVAPAHRGRRLGLRTKLANLDLLRREHPEASQIDTFNAADNRWMVAINEAMGFRPLYRLGDWELDLVPPQAGTTAAISAAASAP